ncbi:small ribosomal subunit protein bS21m isoform X2 [Microcebus murinus]|uniref:small ribosomal subunit protein bS21m isoform X2 n=1 Tax=Microcebus murinus TaxID=30608 RepID=UPI003F6A71E2
MVSTQCFLPLIPASITRRRDSVASASASGREKAASSLGPAVWRLKSKVMANHLKFIARTVMVQEGNVEGAYRTLNRILTMDGLIEDIKRRRYYEKPCRRRQRESYETCRRIYNMEMARKIKFLMRKNRADPWQGC